jgi:hypothetical protein
VIGRATSGPRARVTARLVAALASVLAASLAPLAAYADGPAFDRPGIAFAPSTMPARSFTWEQGLVDYTRDVDRGITTTAWSFDTRLRYGLTDQLELQIEVPVWADTRTQGHGTRSSADGLGDLSLAAKFDLMPGDGDWDLSLLGVVQFPTGDSLIGADGEQYSLGATLGTSFGEGQSLAFYANVDRLRDDTTWTLSSSWGFDLGDALGGYVEAGYVPAGDGDPSNVLAGGGLMWAVKDTVQLDAWVLAGLNRASPDLEVGAGFSYFVP